MLDRLKRLVQAAISDLIEEARDPELELARFVEKLELSRGEVRAEREDARLRCARLSQEAAQRKQAAAEWLAKAENAAAAGDDEAAREGLRRRHEDEIEAAACEERLAEAELALATLNRDEAELDRKLKEARLEQKRLAVRLRRAEAERRAAEALSGGDGVAGAADELDARILAEGATAEAIHEVHEVRLEDEIAALDGGFDEDAELAALKKRIRRKAEKGR